GLTNAGDDLPGKCSGVSLTAVFAHGGNGHYLETNCLSNIRSLQNSCVTTVTVVGCRISCNGTVWTFQWILVVKVSFSRLSTLRISLNVLLPDRVQI
ncbi:hypothetical protein AVEN_160416-1, partial [Araneus ventricosus]